MSTRFRVGNLLDIDDLDTFDTVVDSAFFHVLDDRERVRYVESHGRILRVGGSCFLLCFGDREPGCWPPRRVSEQEIRDSFAGHWQVESIEPTTFALQGRDGIAIAWLARVTRT